MQNQILVVDIETSPAAARFYGVVFNAAKY